MKRILITGKGSYIGCNVESYLKDKLECEIETLDMIGDAWTSFDFSPFDVVFHVAGIAHADVSAVSEETKKLYYSINTDLAVDVAKKAKNDGVGQFIFMSSMIIYSGCKDSHITASTQPNPLNFYGDSKWQADQKIQALGSESFKVVILRPPMIYGPGCKGNYPQLRKLALKLPVFPKVGNRRSMLYIGNLCEFIRLMIVDSSSGVFFPQNSTYADTSTIVKDISRCNGHRIRIMPGFGHFVRLLRHVPGRIGNLASKAFGDLTYDMKLSEYATNYRVFDFEDSIRLTEKGFDN